jgi:mono/diheme cytochrome c family protein
MKFLVSVIFAGSLALATAVGVSAAGLPVASSMSALPPGPGRDVLLRNCSTCHTALNVTTERHDAAGWDQVIGTMIDRGAKVSDADQDAIQAYLAKNFGAPAKPGANAAHR